MLIISAMTLSRDDFRPTVTNFVVRASFAGYDPARHEDLLSSNFSSFVAADRRRHLG